jgi:predicted N-acyltransferase
MDNKQNLLLGSLVKYYENPQNMEAFVEILRDKSSISLRLIDWFVTKYSKQNNTQYDWQQKTFHVYINYRSQLKAYSKKQMDPFCRRERVQLAHHGIEIVTTIGQMNFFRWAIENGVIKYICENYKSLENVMKAENKTLTKKNGFNRGQGKRTFSRTHQHVTIVFD